MANFKYLPQNIYIRALLNAVIICSIIGLGLYLGGVFNSQFNLYIFLIISLAIVLIALVSAKSSNRQEEEYKQIAEEGRINPSNANSLKYREQRRVHREQSDEDFISELKKDLNNITNSNLGS